MQWTLHEIRVLFENTLMNTWEALVTHTLFDKDAIAMNKFQKLFY